MREDEKLDALFALARDESPAITDMAEHFETRLMARLTERKLQSEPWYLLVWRLVPVFAVITAIVLICSFTLNPLRSSDLFASITAGGEERMARSYLAGE